MRTQDSRKYMSFDLIDRINAAAVTVHSWVVRSFTQLLSVSRFPNYVTRGVVVSCTEHYSWPSELPQCLLPLQP